MEMHRVPVGGCRGTVHGYPTCHVLAEKWRWLDLVWINRAGDEKSVLPVYGCASRGTRVPVTSPLHVLSDAITLRTRIVEMSSPAAGIPVPAFMAEPLVRILSPASGDHEGCTPATLSFHLSVGVTPTEPTLSGNPDIHALNFQPLFQNLGIVPAFPPPVLERVHEISRRGRDCRF
jgi:hypothetical protein